MRRYYTITLVAIFMIVSVIGITTGRSLKNNSLTTSSKAQESNLTIVFAAKIDDVVEVQLSGTIPEFPTTTYLHSGYMKNNKFVTQMRVLVKQDGTHRPLLYTSEHFLKDSTHVKLFANGTPIGAELEIQDSIPTPTKTAFCGENNQYDPQPALMTQELCKNGGMPEQFSSDYIPDNIVTIEDAFKDENVQFIGQTGQSIRKEVIPSLIKITQDGFAKLEEDPEFPCVPYIYWGYRSYESQKDLWQKAGCATNSSCGAAYPGWSIHQTGVAVDIWCASVSFDEESEKYVVDMIHPWNSEFRIKTYFPDFQSDYELIHTLSWDIPHFIYYGE